MTKIPAPPEPGLRAELRAIESGQPHHWHCWISSDGHLWATCLHNTCGGSGTTVGSAGSPEGIARAIAEVEHEWQAAA
jgi:hypothetical protein